MSCEGGGPHHQEGCDEADAGGRHCSLLHDRRGHRSANGVLVGRCAAGISEHLVE